MIPTAGRPRSALGKHLATLVCSTMLIIVVGPQCHPHESTKPRRVRATDGVKINAKFLAGGVRGWLAEG